MFHHLLSRVCVVEGTKLYDALSGNSTFTLPKLSLSTITYPGTSSTQHFTLLVVYYRLNYPLFMIPSYSADSYPPVFFVLAPLDPRLQNPHYVY